MHTRMGLLNLVTTLILLTGLFATGSSATAADLKSIEFQSDWGIEPVHIRVTGGGYMIEFRYRVTDPDKALILSERNRALYPRLKAMKSKARLAVPFGQTMGVLKSNRKFLQPGRNYITMFSNEGKHLLPGDEVRIEIGDQMSPEMRLD